MESQTTIVICWKNNMNILASQSYKIHPAEKCLQTMAPPPSLIQKSLQHYIYPVCLPHSIPTFQVCLHLRTPPRWLHSRYLRGVQQYGYSVFAGDAKDRRASTKKGPFPACPFRKPWRVTIIYMEGGKNGFESIVQEPIHWKLQTIILCWWFHSCYYLTETFAELCFLHTFPVRSSTPQMGPFRSYVCMYTIHPQAGNWRIWKAKFPGFILSFTKRTRPAAAAALGYDLWLLPRSLCLHSVVAVTVHIPPFVMALY